MLLPGVIGFYFGFRLCISYLLFEADPRTGAAVSVAINLFLFAIVMFHSLGPTPVAVSSILRVTCVRWVMVFLCFSFFSLVWSATVSVIVAFAYWCGMAADVAMVVLLIRTGPVDRMSAAIMKGYVWGACFIALIAWLSPTMQDLRPGDNDFFSPNAIGFTCAFGVFVAQYLNRSAGGWKFPIVFLSISLLRSLSKTTIIAFLVGELIFVAREPSIPRKNKIFFAVLSMIVIAAFWRLIAGYYSVYTNAGNQAETLTGRIGIWAFVLQRSIERPWIGHGFHSFRNVIPPFGTFEAWHAHNELLQQFYAYGVAGIVIVGSLYTSFYLQIKRFAPTQLRTLLSSLLIFILVRGLGDTERFDLSFPLWSIVLISVAVAGPKPFGEVAI
jgi:O-antigen ligase